MSLKQYKARIGENFVRNLANSKASSDEMRIIWHRLIRQIKNFREGFVDAYLGREFCCDGSEEEQNAWDESEIANLPDSMLKSMQELDRATERHRATMSTASLQETTS